MINHPGPVPPPSPGPKVGTTATPEEVRNILGLNGGRHDPAYQELLVRNYTREMDGHRLIEVVDVKPNLQNVFLAHNIVGHRPGSTISSCSERPLQSVSIAQGTIR